MATTADTPVEDVAYEEQPDYLQAQSVWTIGSPIIIVLGTIGNLLSAAVMMRRTLRVHTTSLYLVVLAAVDTLVLYTGLLRYWVMAVFGTDVRSLSTSGCKFHIFIVYLLLQYEAWILVSVAVERFVAIYVPTKSKQIFTKKFAAIQLAVMGLCFVVLNAHFFWTYTIIEDGDCYISHMKHDHFVNNVWNWLDFCLASLVPFVIMLSLNLAIIGKLVHLTNIRKKNLNVKHDVKMTSMTAILLTINFVFFLTTAPIALYLSTQNKWYAEVETFADFARLDLVWACVNIVAYTNNAINFVLYCLSGPRFRRELIKMLRLDKLRATKTQPVTEQSMTVNNMENTQVDKL